MGPQRCLYFWHYCWSGAFMWRVPLKNDGEHNMTPNYISLNISAVIHPILLGGSLQKWFKCIYGQCDP